MACSEFNYVLVFTLTNRSKCPESRVTFRSPLIQNEEQREAFIANVVGNVISQVNGSDLSFNYDPTDVVPQISFMVGNDNFVIKLGRDPLLIINNVAQFIPPNNIFSYEYVDANGILRKKSLTFFESFFTLKDEDSNLIYYSDLNVVRYEMFDL